MTHSDLFTQYESLQADIAGINEYQQMIRTLSHYHPLEITQTLEFEELLSLNNIFSVATAT